MICPQCQAENREGVKFCEDCGAKMEIQCPQCRAVIPLGKRFCGECGHDLRQPGVAPPIDYNEPQSYTPKHLADKILSNRTAIEGERKLVTILFADVANSTAMFENLDPEDVHEIMDGCFRILMDEIHRYEGSINQFRGDGVMALFGAPIAHEDHAQRACHASLAIQDSLGPYAERLKREYGMDFTMRIGLNSGPVVVGAIGDDLRMDYTAQGDTANLAARMETNAEPGKVLASENTYRLAKGYFDFDSLGRIQVKGKTEPVKTYQLVRSSEVETRIGTSVAKGLTRFVGRKREFVTLKEAFDKARSGEGQVVGVVGEAGVGKSRLLLEFRNSLPKHEHIYLEGRSLHYGSSMPYLPMLDALRSYLGIKEGAQESVIKERMIKRIVGSDENLTRCLPPLQELFSLKVDDDKFRRLEPIEKREKTFEALRDIFIRGSQSRPILLAIEDLHWIDKTTEEFLDYMIGWLPNTRILLILLYRPEYTHQWGSKSYYSKVGVGQLSTGTSAELVQAILEGGDVVPELRELILNRASGNPLYMEELTHSLLENGSIQQRDENYVLASGAADIQVPDTIQGVIAARMDRLEETLKRLLQVASVIGREFFFRILQSITGMQDELKAHLLNLQGLEFIYEKRLFPELEYIFKHALTQEVAYNSLLLRRRIEIHEKIGLAMEELFPERLGEFYGMLAYHYSKSENREKAHYYLFQAGNKAVKSHSLWEAYQFYRDAVEVLDACPQNEENLKQQIVIISAMAPVTRMLAYPDGSLEFLEKGEKLARQVEDSRQLVSLSSMIANYHTFKGGNPLIGRKYLERSFLEAECKEDVELLAPLATDLFVSYMATGEFRRTQEMAPKVINLIRKTGRQQDFFGRPATPYLSCLLHWGVSYGRQGYLDEANRILDEARRFGVQTEHHFGLGLIEGQNGAVYLWLGDTENSIRHITQSIKHFEDAQAPLWQGQLWTWLGYAYHLQGESDTAIRYIVKGLKMQSDLGSQTWFCTHHMFYGAVQLDIGELSKAADSLESAINIAEKNNESDNLAYSKILLGRTIARLDSSHYGHALEHILNGIQMLEDLNLKPMYSQGYLFLSEVYSAMGKREDALESLKRAQSLFREMGMDWWLGKAQEALASL